MSETITIKDKVYNITDLPEAGQKALNGYRVAMQRMDVARLDYEIATAARDHFGAIVEASTDGVEEVADDTAGTES